MKKISKIAAISFWAAHSLSAASPEDSWILKNIEFADYQGHLQAYQTETAGLRIAKLPKQVLSKARITWPEANRWIKGLLPHYPSYSINDYCKSFAHRMTEAQYAYDSITIELATDPLHSFAEGYFENRAEIAKLHVAELNWKDLMAPSYRHYKEQVSKIQNAFTKDLSEQRRAGVARAGILQLDLTGKGSLACDLIQGKATLTVGTAYKYESAKPIRERLLSEQLIVDAYMGLKDRPESESTNSWERSRWNSIQFGMVLATLLPIQERRNIEEAHLLKLLDSLVSFESGQKVLLSDQELSRVLRKFEKISKGEEQESVRILQNVQLAF